MSDGVPLRTIVTPESAGREEVRTDKHQRLRGALFSERHVRVICIGAGASGLCFAYKLQRSFENYTLTVYEKNVEVSGTWFENKYPGCACDVPAHNYTWSWEPNPDVSAVYAKASELFNYFHKFATKNDLYRYIKLEHLATCTRWNGDSWDVDIENLKTGEVKHDQCDILINASGILNAWKWPAIPGLKDFQGQLLHSANWDQNACLEGKTVGLIGNGYILTRLSALFTTTLMTDFVCEDSSSGIQILPAIQPKVKQLITFVRAPTWISPVQGLEQHIYSQEELDTFSSNPGELRKYRKMVETDLNNMFSTFLQNTESQKRTKTEMKEQMKAKLNNPALESKLIPKWGPGCRRLTPGIGYLETLGKENVTVQYGEITKITSSGCVINGIEHPVDILICATGFDVSFRPRFPIIGPAGDLREQWAIEAKGYLGTAAPDIPNYFTFLGPNCPIGNGPVLSAIEKQADYMLKWIDRWQTENIRSFAPKMDAVEDFIEHTDEFMKRSVWVQDCRSWYKNGMTDGRVSALWPGSTLHFLEAMEYLRHDDFNITYEGNRYAWMGNGYSQTELDQTADWGYYIRDVDDGPFLSKTKRRKQLTHQQTLEGLH